MITKFELNETEIKTAKDFIAKLPKKYKEMYKNGDYEFIFSPGSGIGIGVTIKVGKKEKDITDYSNW
jgi:hypothetical protein